jgi:hypothetical protein
LVYNKTIVARKKGDKDYTRSEKQIMISLINDYQIFGAIDSEIIQMLFRKTRQEYIRNPFLPIEERSGEEKRRIRRMARLLYKIPFYRTL